MAQQPLRGSKAGLINVTIEGIKLAGSFKTVKQIRLALKGLINFLEKERDQYKSKRNEKRKN